MRKHQTILRETFEGKLRRVLKSEIVPPRKSKPARMFIAVDPFGTLAAASSRYRKSLVKLWLKQNVSHHYGWRVVSVDVKPTA